jgi:membrane fusion protein, copper/silver efflux system
LILYVMGCIACQNKKVSKIDDVFYTCPMHPEMISNKPGNCRICRMQLVPIEKKPVHKQGDLQLNDQQIQLGNIHTDTIRSGQMGEELLLTGILNMNGKSSTSVNARVMGRIERLYVKNVGDYVSKGMVLYELYSEELNNAKQEYILALQRKKLFSKETVIDVQDMLEPSKNKLRLWGLSEAQINALDSYEQAPLTTSFYSTESGYITSVNVTEGSYVMEGGTIIQLADLSTLWAEAQVYATQVLRIPGGGRATVQIPDAGIELNGKIEFANPELSPDSRITLVRITIPNQGNHLRPGMSAFISIKTAERYTLSLPTDAVIREKKGATVWLQTGRNTFRSQMVTTGIESNGITEISHGLKAGDVVVVSGTYLLHSEYIFKNGVDPMQGHKH